MADPRLPARLPVGFAHRGARAHEPENTLAAFRRALALGATGLESDAWLTADGVVVLDHDGVVRLGGRRRPIATLRQGQLPEHIPSLGELYHHCGTAYQLSLDVKDPAAAGAVIEVAGQAGVRERLWLCDSRLSRLAEWRAVDDVVHLVESTRLTEIPEGLHNRARTLAGAGIDAVNLRQREWTAQTVAAVHGAGLLAFGWGAQQLGTLRRLLDTGVDGVYSDHVDRMMRAINERGAQD